MANSVIEAMEEYTNFTRYLDPDLLGIQVIMRENKVARLRRLATRKQMQQEFFRIECDIFITHKLKSWKEKLTV